MRTLVVCSGGLDSVTLSHKIVVEETLIHLALFDYGQRHKKELEYACCCAMRIGVPHDVVDITDIGRRLTGSALTDGAAVPEGHYAEETMRLTVVPNRNAIMLTIAFGIAMARGAEAVAAVSAAVVPASNGAKLFTLLASTIPCSTTIPTTGSKRAAHIWPSIRPEP